VHRTVIAFASILTLALPGIGLAQNPRGKAETSLAGKKISIEYGRPSMKGRDLLSQAPAGTVWRTGADESTTFTTEADLSVNGTTIPKGSYSLFTKRVDDKTWNLVFNKKTGEWGTEHDASQDFATAPLKWEQKASGPEMFTIELASTGPKGELQLSWGKNVLSAPVEAK
jgi:Protein of unknown function (DUF2911)